MRRRSAGGAALTILTWALGVLFVFPVFWMVLTSFKQESDAYTEDPTFLFTPTLDQYRLVFDGGLGPYLANSLIATVVSCLLVVVLAVPAAYALSVRPVRGTKDALFFFISTKMLPVVAAIVPIFVAAQQIHLLDNVWALVLLYSGMNLPIAVWMMRSFFQEVPSEVLEAAKVDGAGLRTELTRVLLPMVSSV